MKILAIDLGETTGYCLLDSVEKESVYSFGTLQLGDDLPDNVIHQLPNLVVVERPAFIGAGARVQGQYSDALHLYRLIFGAERVKVVKPADWMPRFHSYPLPMRGMLRTQHEKDAYRMARWALDKFGGQK